MAVEELYAIAAAMRKAGGGGIRRDAARSLRRGAGPVSRAVKENVVTVLPHRGGLGLWVAQARVDYRVRQGGLDVVAHVRVGRAGHDLRGLDGGIVIHPFYGRGPWSSQGVPPGSISNPIREEGGNQLEQAGVAAIDRAVAMIISA